jgi:protein of unknown function (DUF1778)
VSDHSPANIIGGAFTKGGKYIIMETPNSNGGVLVGWVENKIERTRKYNKENYEQIKMQVPKGTKAVIKAAAERAGKSMTAFIMEAVNEKMNK